MKLLKSYDFWIRLFAVLVLLVNVIGARFGLDLSMIPVMDIATCLASFLVVIGVIKVPATSVSQKTENLNKLNKGVDMETINKDLKEELQEAIEKLSSVSTKFGLDVFDGAIMEAKAQIEKIEVQQANEASTNCGEEGKNLDESEVEIVEVCEEEIEEELEQSPHDTVVIESLCDTVYTPSNEGKEDKVTTTGFSDEMLRSQVLKQVKVFLETNIDQIVDSLISEG